MDTDLRLYTGVPLASDNLNFMDDYTNETEKLLYFESFKFKSFPEHQQIRRTQNSIVVEGTIDEIEKCNYITFKNGDGKRFYCYVSNVVFESENGVRIFFEVDSVTTYLLDLTIKTSMIERETVSDDSVGLHRIDEGLNIGDVVVNSMEEIEEIKDIVIIMGSTIDPTQRDPGTNKFIDVQGDIYSYLYSGLSLFQVTKAQLNTIIEQFTLEGQIDGLKTIFTVPRNMVADFDPTTFRLDAPIPSKVTFQFPPSFDIDGYIPKNNKLKVFPFNFLECINNQGGSSIYRYEDFELSNGNMLFDYTCGLAPNPTIILSPKGYNGIFDSYNEQMTLSGFPLCSWTSDLYTNWKAQNQVSNALGVGQGALSFGTGVATGNIIGAVAGIQSIAGSIGAFYEKSILPNPLSGSTSGSDSIASETLTFTFLKKSVRATQAKMIDDFFTKYGYRVNRLGVPNLKSRTSFNYIKTTECNIFGSIPADDLEKIRRIFNSGVTFWHTKDVGNYNLTN